MYDFLLCKVMKLIPKTSKIVLETMFFYNTLSFPKAYVIKFILFYAVSRQILQIIRENFGGMENSSYLCGVNKT